MITSNRVRQIFQYFVSKLPKLSSKKSQPPFIWAYCSYDEQSFDSYTGIHIEFPDGSIETANTGDVQDDLVEVERIVREKGFEQFACSSTVGNYIVDLDNGTPISLQVDDNE